MYKLCALNFKRLPH